MDNLDFGSLNSFDSLMPNDTHGDTMQVISPTTQPMASLQAPFSPAAPPGSPFSQVSHGTSFPTVSQSPFQNVLSSPFPEPYADSTVGFSTFNGVRTGSFSHQ